MKAQFQYKLPKKKVQCTLCPHFCILKPGEIGDCHVRENKKGELFSKNYSILTALHADPIEKKPLYHFKPGSKILSAGTFGCNLHCNFCQNHSISQSSGEDLTTTFKLSPQDLVKKAQSIPDNIGIAYTYNEPTIWYEYVLETSIIAQKVGLKNVLVSNGFINKEPAKRLFPNIDAFNIDLKAFDNKFYKEQAGGTLKPVKETIKYISSLNKHLEITFLIIPNLNDDLNRFRELLKFVKDHTGQNTVIHLSRYFPSFKSQESPTPVATLKRFFEEAQKFINFVYVGNINSDFGKDTFCPECKTKLIKRNAYQTQLFVNPEGKCPKCDHAVHLN